MKRGKRVLGSGGYESPIRDGSGTKKVEEREEKREKELEEVIREQSEKAEKFYEQLWRREEEKERKKKDCWESFDRMMKTAMAVKTVKVYDEEVEDLRKELAKICRKYRKIVLRLLEKAKEENEEVKELKNILEDDEALKRYVKDGNIRAEIAISFVLRVLLKLTTKVTPRKVLRDLEKAYMLARKLSVKTGDFNNVLAIFEGLALKAISARKHQKIIQRMYYMDTGVTRVIYSDGRTYTRMYPLKKPCFRKVVKEEIKPRIPVSLVMDIAGISVSQRTKVRGNITAIGAKDHFDYPFRSDFIGYLDSQGKRIVRIELNRFLSADESLKPFEYGDV